MTKREPRMPAYKIANVGGFLVITSEPPCRWPTLDRATARQRSARPVSDPLPMVEQDGWCTIPGRQIKPLPKRVLIGL